MVAIDVLVTQRGQHANSADAEDQLLAQTIIGIAAVQHIGQTPILSRILRQVRVQGVGGHDHASVDAALEVIASRAFPLELMRTHTLPLAHAERAIRMVGRELDGEDPIHVTLVP